MPKSKWPGVKQPVGGCASSTGAADGILLLFTEMADHHVPFAEGTLLQSLITTKRPCCLLLLLLLHLPLYVPQPLEHVPLLIHKPLGSPHCQTDSLYQTYLENHLSAPGQKVAGVPFIQRYMVMVGSTL
jgi:hypothetical protein